MFTTNDTLTVLLALRDLLAEFPPTTDPAAVSARHQARMILKRYNALFHATKDHIDA
jgi:hypothetical protein